MSSIFDKNLLPEFESVKDDDETIMWIGKPVFVPYVLSDLGYLAGSLVIGLFIFYVMLNSENNEGNTLSWLIPAFLVGQGLLKFLIKVFSFSNTAYGYSNKRVMMRTGFIGTDFKTIDYDKISDIEVNVNVIDRMYEVGTIRFFSGRTKTDDSEVSKLYDNWYAIPNPYKIFKMVKQVSVDVKTDYTYPNALRPDVNPGYKTKYKRD